MSVHIKVGHFYWIFGGDYLHEHISTWADQEKTSLFSLKKEMWIEGPDLPDLFIQKGGAKSVCVTALNRTSVLFIGSGESMQEMLFFDFAKVSWIEFESSPKPKITWCTSSSAHDKNYNQYV